MANVVDQEDFNDLKDRVRDLEADFDDKVNEKVAEILRELAATIVCWPNLSLGIISIIQPKS